MHPQQDSAVSESVTLQSEAVQRARSLRSSCNRVHELAK
jgi:hypothetical protein